MYLLLLYISTSISVQTRFYRRRRFVFLFLRAERVCRDGNMLFSSISSDLIITSRWHSDPWSPPLSLISLAVLVPRTNEFAHIEFYIDTFSRLIIGRWYSRYRFTPERCFVNARVRVSLYSTFCNLFSQKCVILCYDDLYVSAYTSLFISPCFIYCVVLFNCNDIRLLICWNAILIYT